jgi:molybdopterin molybdotransferase
MAAGAAGADLLVTSGGASVGDHDLVKSALAETGLELDFWRIAMRPGKPLLFGRMGGVPLMGMPGNPVSTLVCATVFLKPAMEVMLGLAPTAGPAATALLGRDLAQNDERQDYLRATLTHDHSGQPVATPIPVQDSSMISRLALADCLVIRQPYAPAAKAGTRVDILPLSGGALST